MQQIAIYIDVNTENQDAAKFQIQHLPSLLGTKSSGSLRS
jgi:hypothetical protein